MAEKMIRSEIGSTTPTPSLSPIPEAPTITPLSDNEKLIEKRLVRRLDLMILPLIAMSFFLNCIDRNNYAAARLQHIERDLHMSDAQFQTGLSVFYVGYTIFQIPSNMVLNHFGRPSWHIGLSILAWGLVTACTSTVKSFNGLVACRVVLGCVEAPVYPGMIFYLSKWYKQSELSLRLSICLSAGIIASATGSLIAAGISASLDGARGLEAWRWLYIIEGAVSILGGFVLIALLPDFPHTWAALTPATREVAIRRLTLETSTTDLDSTITPLRGLYMALADPKLYLMTAINTGIIASIGCQNFFPTMTRSLGYSNIISLLLVAPPFVFTAIYSWIHSYLSDKTGHRFWFVFYPAPIAITGFVIFMSPISSFGVRYFSMFLMLFIYSMNTVISAWIASVMSRPPAKRAAAMGFVSMIANGCAVWTPFTYRERDSPHWRLALGIVVGLLTVSAVLSVVLRGVLVRINRRFDEREREMEGVEGRRVVDEKGEMEVGVQRQSQGTRSFRYPI
ncbi:major facilitator superfamily domain-containing protein [Aspergillus karnatakaensis]|uniref:major facilitator superfamily domain-containing protein n=1 Tax=Aspergillus karnatakaensis TaxID=1810916 RepID=UPI003CCD7347